MQHEVITAADHLREFCAWLEGARIVAFDTEFISEGRYRPLLCLIQVAATAEKSDAPRLALIDPLAVGDVAPFWRALSQGEHVSVAHSGREELLFCLRDVGKRPARLFDVQLAAGMLGYDYPAGYSNLLGRVLGVDSKKAETRTDWRLRPLSERQVQYALDDVRYLLPLYERLRQRLSDLNREDWLRQEMDAWQEQVQTAMGAEQWRRVSGAGGLSSRSLAIVRQLWRWREARAQRQDKPPRRVLRDDLIVELARRRTSDPKRIQAVRGFERRDLRKLVDDLAREIETALHLPESECPQRAPRDTSPQRTMLGQFLSSALGSLCADAQVSPGLVGNPSDVRDFIAWRLGERPGADEAPPLLRGWRAEVVGRVLDDLLQGRRWIRVADPRSDQPLAFEAEE